MSLLKFLSEKKTVDLLTELEELQVKGGTSGARGNNEVCDNGFCSDDICNHGICTNVSCSHLFCSNKVLCSGTGTGSGSGSGTTSDGGLISI